MDVAATEPRDERRDALAGRLFDATIGAFELLSVHLGLDLGLYRALHDEGPATAPGLAARRGIHERYAREWLEQQAVAGLLDVVEASDDPDARRYALPDEHADVLLDPEHLSTMAPMPRFVMAAARTWPVLLEAYRTGDGIDWTDYPHLSEAQELANRPVFGRLLADEWLPAVPDVHEQLRRGGARVADVAAGAGWSSIAMARGYPGITVDAIDLDAAAIARGRENAAAAGVADRVRFHLADAADHSLDGQFDVATIFEAVHDLARPVEVLRAVRQLLKPGGVALVMDEKVAHEFTAPGDAIERLMYSYSVFFCLANGLAERPSAGTGTVMRPATFARYAADAGFASVEILPIEHDVFRFYLLHPAAAAPPRSS